MLVLWKPVGRYTDCLYASEFMELMWGFFFVFLYV